MIEQEQSGSGWTARERGLAVTAGVIALVIVVLVVITLIPRGGEPPVGSAPTGNASPTPMVPDRAPSASPDAQPTATVVASATAVLAPVIDFDGLATLAAYRFRMEVEGSGANSPVTPIDGEIALEGMVTTDPRAVDISMENVLGPGTTLRIVAIRERAWVDVGEGLAPSGEEPEAVAELIDAYQPESLFTQYVGGMPADAYLVDPDEGEETTHDGVAVTRYAIPASELELAGRSLTMTGTFAIHVERRVPVFLEISVLDPTDASAFYRVSMSLTNLDDPTLEVVSPQP